MKINKTKIEILLAKQILPKKEFANKCGVSRQNLSTILRRGTCEPKTVGKIAMALGVDPVDIIEQE